MKTKIWIPKNIKALVMSGVVLGLSCIPYNAKANVLNGAYLCKKNGSSLLTVYKDPNGSEFAFIDWKYNYYEDSGWTPQRRCEHVAQKFEINRKAQNLSHIVPGTYNNHAVVCASKYARSTPERCQDSEVLFTVLSFAHQSDVMTKLIDENTKYKNYGPNEAVIALSNMVSSRDVKARPASISISSMLNHVPKCKRGHLGFLICN